MNVPDVPRGAVSDGLAILMTKSGTAATVNVKVCVFAEVPETKAVMVTG